MLNEIIIDFAATAAGTFQIRWRRLVFIATFVLVVAATLYKCILI